MTDQNPTPIAEPTTPPSAVGPISAVRMARVGGTIAELAAAAISAHTLYHLGGQLDLGPDTAWLLPAALDVYAFTALAVGYNLATDHPAQKAVLRNARLAFTMTLACNALDHLLRKAGRLINPTARDLLLVAVATLPPLVVERLLNLQSLLVGNQASAVTRISASGPQPVADERFLSQDTLAQSSTPTAAAVHAQKPCSNLATASRPDWVALGADVFADLSARLNRRPTGREFQQALAAHTRNLSAEGRLSPDVRPPSVSSTKRLRTALESSTTSGAMPAADSATAT